MVAPIKIGYPSTTMSSNEPRPAVSGSLEVRAELTAARTKMIQQLAGCDNPMETVQRQRIGRFRKLESSEKPRLPNFSLLATKGRETEKKN
jgi:hypothetical protein